MKEEEDRKEERKESKTDTFFIQPQDCRLDVNWKFEFINPEEKNKDKEK